MKTGSVGVCEKHYRQYHGACPGCIEAGREEPSVTKATELEDMAKEVVVKLRITDSDHKPQHLHLVVLNALVKAESSGFYSGWNARGGAAVAQVNALKQTKVIARDYARKAGREQVASHRDTDIETCDRIIEIIQSIEAKNSEPET
jgi:hypothetical protein